MIYITEDDLKTDAQGHFIEESKADDLTSPDKIEKRMIEFVIAKLPEDLYDANLIFNELAPIRNEVLVSIISKLTLYNLFKRNSARKITTTIKEDYEWALKELDSINTGRTTLRNLPKPEVAPEPPATENLYGNLSNRDFYI